MTGLGAKPEDIQRVLATAERNARKAPPQILSFSAGPGAPGGAPGAPGTTGAMPGGPAGMPGAAPGAMMPGAPGGMQQPQAAGGPQRGGRGGVPGAGAGISEDQRTALFSRMIEQLSPAAKKEIDKMMGGKKMQDLSADQRNKVFTKLREASLGAGAPGGRGEGGGRQRGAGGEAPVPALIAGFTEADRENAKLPLPPEEDNQLEVLLRPGLLADVEIIVDKI